MEKIGVREVINNQFLIKLFEINRIITKLHKHI